MEKISSDVRNAALRAHGAIIYAGNLVLKPVIAVLNYFDETGSFARYLRRQEKK